jgi:hypothetical protein
MGVLGLIAKFHDATNTLIKNRLPYVSLYYYIKPRSWFYWHSQPIHQLVNGASPSASKNQSFIFFTVHKSASMLMENFLNDVSKETKMPQIDINGYFATQGDEGIEKQKEKNFLQKIFKAQGYVYGPLRFYLPVPELEKYPVVLLLRDPRDVLTSQYYSIRATHPLITKKLIERRKIALKSTVDEHVRSQTPRFVQTYNEYIENVLGKPNVLFLKYEDMVNDFGAFIEKINAHCKLNLTPEQILKLDRTKTFETQGEDRSQHKRKVIPGDHKEKLQPETIEWLNKEFDDILKTLNYTK